MPIRPSQANNDIYLGTNSASANRFDSPSMTYAKNARQLPISNEVLRVLKPLGIEAALRAIEAQSSTTTAAERQLELSLQQARYEAAHARRQYDAVDPANRLVAGELERRWNEALQAIARIEGDIAA